MARPDCIYCKECQERAQEPLGNSLDLSTLDVEVLPLRELPKEEGPVLQSLKRYGTRACGLCGKPALIGRQYCSEECRKRAREGKGQLVEVDGIVATVPEHATLYTRLQSGKSFVEALSTPIDPEMRRRRLCQKKKEKKKNGETV